MEPRCSLSCSQKPGSGSYCEPEEFKQMMFFDDVVIVINMIIILDIVHRRRVFLNTTFVKLDMFLSMLDL